jgi:alcohol dehydrogenase (cytochrome c)
MSVRRLNLEACCALLALALGACGLIPDAPVAAPASAEELLARMRPVTPAILRDPAPADWLQWGRTYDGQNFSPLNRINRDNVKTLARVWSSPIQGGLSMPTPLVHDGVMFLQTNPDTVLALNAATGSELWRFTRPPVGVSSTMKMGLSLSGGLVLVPTSDLHVLALDAHTGAKVWDQEIAIIAPAVKGTTLGLRSAPLIVGDKVIQGVTTSFVPGGGFIVALDIATGKELWRFNTIARPGEPGGETWNGLPLDKRSGGSVWHQGTWDRDLNLIYYGVAPTYDTGPMLKSSGVPGTTRDALYTNSTIALNPDTGKLVWHYQHLANDQWDLDWVFERQLATFKIGGRDRRVVMTMGKMGILEAMDAATGAYLFSIDAGTQNIITAIDPVTGAKTIDPARLPDPARPTVYCPGPSGARSWPPTSFSKNTGLLYVPLTEWCMQMSEKGGVGLLSAPGSGLSAADHPDAVKDGKMGRLQAMDVSGKKLGWTHDLDAPIPTSALSTAGGVVFAGDLDPSLKAFDDRDGKLLWTAALDNYPSSSVITYSVGQTQYVAVVVGMGNNHINDMSRRYQAFRVSRGQPAIKPAGGAAIQVFALAK